MSQPDYPAVLAEKLADSVARPPGPLTPRFVHGRTFMPGKATAVVGMRRAGKTCLLHQWRQERLASGGTLAQLPYINLEDERLAGIQASDLAAMVEGYYRQHPELREDSTVTWCLDEIQVVPGWERFVRRLLDTEHVEVLVTGSSAALLSREIATALRGRAWEVLLHPFSFREALLHRGEALPGTATPTARARSRIEHAFVDYLAHGGFPEAQGLDAASRFQLLRDYVDVAMLRDVMERHAVANLTALRALVRHLLGNPASLFSIEKFHSALKSQGIAVARDTLHQMLAHLADCFLVRTVWMESSSERQRMVNPRKVYPVDPGLIPVFDRSGRANAGHALETAVLVELERRRAEVTWVRTASGFEIDFLARYGDGSQELIQVCADASDPATLSRELRALEDAATQFPAAQRRLLTMTQAGLPGATPKGIDCRPAWQWLLTDT